MNTYDPWTKTRPSGLIMYTHVKCKIFFNELVYLISTLLTEILKKTGVQRELDM